MRFSWDENKEVSNLAAHGVDFTIARAAFDDPRHIIAVDAAHSGAEPRFFCHGSVAGRVITVRFTLRDGIVRIIGAGYWRKGRKIYENR